MKIQFLGATNTVTGSKYFVQTDCHRFLVDCGLFQGYKQLRLRNWKPLPIDVSQLDFILLSHAHIDHSGYIPLLVKQGFRGKIYCSKATRDLCAILLPDSGYLQEEEARYANRHGYSKHRPALPLYTEEDAENALTYFSPIEFDKPLVLPGDLRIQFQYAGHILGAAFIHLSYRHRSLLFSGDLGREVDPIMRAPSPPMNADYLVIESTYGDRLHNRQNPMTLIADVINRTVERSGVILIPSFAVGRAQMVLYFIYQLKKQNKIPDVPLYIDSPMTTEATKLFHQHAAQHKLSSSESAEVCRAAHYIRDAEQSMALDEQSNPMIIISASGMVTGGRILHHVKRFAPNPRNTLLFVGFQADNTRGDRIVRGESPVKMLGGMVPINAEVAMLENISAHADYQEMLNWLSQLTQAPKKVFITHGERGASEALKEKINQRWQWSCSIPDYLETEELK
jgi:metallo-beta-lactamase family protein